MYKILGQIKGGYGRDFKFIKYNSLTRTNDNFNWLNTFYIIEHRR